jgi:hypothetical protein
MSQAMFILWSDALPLVEDCRKLLQESCIIQADIEYEWSDALISENMRRLYQQPIQLDKNLDFGREKMSGKNLHIFYVSTHIGDNIFHRSAAGEIEFVNSNILSLKSKFRELVYPLTGSPYSVHCASSSEELKLQSALIFGLTEHKRLEKGELILDKFKKADLCGSGGWNSLHDAFQFISSLTSWCVMRGWESLPDYVSGDDLDTLVENRKLFFAALGLKQPNNHDFLRNGYLEIKNSDTFIKLDVHWIGDGYFDTKWQYNFLANKIPTNGFFIPDKINALMTHLYSEYVLRPSPRPEKFETLARLIKEIDHNNIIDQEILINQNAVIALLNDFMSQNNYTLSIPVVKRHTMANKAKKILKKTAKRPFGQRSAFTAAVIAIIKWFLPEFIQEKIRELKLNKQS